MRATSLRRGPSHISCDQMRCSPSTCLSCILLKQTWLLRLPLTNGIKQLLTFYVFGFDFKTKFKRGTCGKKMAAFVVSYVAKLAFILLAFNSYVSDFRKFQSRESHNLDNLWQSALIILAAPWQRLESH